MGVCPISGCLPHLTPHLMGVCPISGCLPPLMPHLTGVCPISRVPVLSRRCLPHLTGVCPISGCLPHLTGACPISQVPTPSHGCLPHLRVPAHLTPHLTGKWRPKQPAIARNYAPQPDPKCSKTVRLAACSIKLLSLLQAPTPFALQKQLAHWGKIKIDA